MKEVVTASVQYAMRAPLHAHFKDLPTSDMKEIPLQRMLEENYDKGHEDHRMAYEALQKSILHDKSEQFDADKVKERKNMKRASGITGASDSAQYPLPPPPSPTTNPDDQSPSSSTPCLSKTAATTAYTAWTTTTSRFEPSASSILEDVFMHEESDFAAQDMVSDDEDIGSRHIPIVNLNQDWFKPLSEDKRPATLEPAWSIHSSSILVLIYNWASAIASSYVPPPENSPLLQTGDIGVFINWFCKKQGIIELTTGTPGRSLHMKLSKPRFHPECDSSLISYGGMKILSSAVNLWLRNLVIRQRVEDFQLGIESYQTQLNLTKPLWEATGLEFMYDYKILDSLRAVVFRDKNGISEESSGTWRALLVEEYEKETTDFFREQNDDIFSVTVVLRLSNAYAGNPIKEILLKIEST
ncbi:hypothetical protein Tco_0370039 [Tanacetum coccineum]